VATFVGTDMLGRCASRFFHPRRDRGTSRRCPPRGFGALENDAGVLGDVFIDPGSRTFAGLRLHGQGYTIKTAASCQFDDTTFGLIGRYQDGQHFGGSC
jgi:hypothetical protein